MTHVIYFSRSVTGSTDTVETAGDCLHTDLESMTEALTSRTIATRGQVVKKELRKDEADTARDAFARVYLIWSDVALLLVLTQSILP